MLTDLAIRKAKPLEKPYKLTDERQLYLFVSTTGAKSFRLNYKINKKEKILTFGQWPEITLARARELAVIARGVLAEGGDPGQIKKQRFAALQAQPDPSLEIIAREWHTKQKVRWTLVQSTAVIRSLERDVFPTLGNTPLTSITIPDIRRVLADIETRGAIETAHRIRRRLESVWSYAIANDWATKNLPEQLKGTLTVFNRNTKQPAALTLDDARNVYVTASAYPAAAETRACFQLLALTAVRPGDAREAAWSELTDLEGANPIWRIPASRMKGSAQRKSDPGNDHIVPLSPQAVHVIRNIRSLTGDGALIFPSPRFPNRPLTDLALSMLLRRAGFEGIHVPHGWRASFSTIMNDLHPEQSSVIDACLAHQVRGVEGRYNRKRWLVPVARLSLTFSGTPMA